MLTWLDGMNYYQIFLSTVTFTTMYIMLTLLTTRHLHSLAQLMHSSTVHVKNVALQRFVRRYLFQKAISVFEWKLPETWNRDYFLYVLYAWGYIGVVETNKYGVICQAGVPYGYDIYYQPTNLIITNPLLKGALQPRIGKECTVFKLQPDWGGINDLGN